MADESVEAVVMSATLLLLQATNRDTPRTKRILRCIVVRGLLVNTFRNYYHTYVPTEPTAKPVVTHWPLNFMLKLVLTVPSFTTIRTFLPARVLNATLYRLPDILLEMRTDPGGTYFDA